MRTRNRAKRGVFARALDPVDRNEPRSWSLESLEDRRLRADWNVVAYVDDFDFLSDPGWSVLFGTVQVGDASRDVAAIEFGDAEGAYTYSYGSWDDDGGRFDSGWREFWFHADVLSGSALWSVEGMPQVSHAGTQAYASVTEVLVVAAVARPRMRMTWEGLTVTIRDGFGLQGPEYFHGSLRADTFARIDAGAQQQQVLHVLAPTDGFNEVIVQGYVRLEAEAGVRPESGDIFGQVLIRAA